MGEVINMRPKGDLKSKAFIKDFLDQYGEELEGVIIIGISKDGEVVDGWSSECSQRIITCLGMIEQFKLDFWDSNFLKRSDGDQTIS